MYEFLYDATIFYIRYTILYIPVCSLLLDFLSDIWISLWYNNYDAIIFYIRYIILCTPVYSCLFLSIPVCSLLLNFLSGMWISLWCNNSCLFLSVYAWISHKILISLPLNFISSLNVWFSYMISEFLYEKGKKKWRKYIENKERKKEKEEKEERRK